MKEHQLNVNGTTIYVNEYSRNGEPLVLLHYSGGSTAIWNGVIPLLEKDYTLITLDLRGHGLSDQPEAGYELENMAQDVKEVLDQLSIPKAHLVGSSLGCYVAVTVASRYPENVISIVNSEGAMQQATGEHGKYTETKEQLLDKYFGANHEREFDSFEHLMQEVKRNWLPWNERREKALLINKQSLRTLPNGKLTTKQTIATRRQIFLSTFHWDMKKTYADIQCPVLFLPAEKEGDLSKKLLSIDGVKAALPYSKTVIIPGTSHAMMFDHHEELVEEIRAFHQEVVK